MQRRKGGRSMQQPRIFFAVALHEKYALPTDALYTPIQAGAAIHPPLGLMRDDTGENISAKNGSYCELTVLYWMAHNVDADWYGLCHYRRYFSLRRTGCPQKRILTRAQLLPLLDTADIFLPKKRHYWLETNFTQYAHAHHEEDLWKARAALARLHPGQERVFDRVMARRSGHRFNLMLMRRDALQSYASWLFPLLDAAEIDTTGYSARDKRVHGFLAERLLDVWLPKSRRRDYYFTFTLISISIFLMIFLLGSVKLKIGFALGLFAIFGIIRYRTESMPVREMTYLFVIIAISVINALSVQLSYAELTATNLLFILCIWLCESNRWLKHISCKLVQYDRIELITPQRRAELIMDLENRTGLSITKVEVGHIDFLRDAAILKVYYEPESEEINTIDTLRWIPREGE